MRDKRKRLSVLLICVLTALCAAGCADRAGSKTAPELLPAAGVAADLYTVPRGDLSVPRLRDASVAAYTEELSLPEDAVIKEVLVYSGQRVCEGDVLLTVDLDAERERAQELRKQLEYDDRIRELDDEIAEAEIARLRNELSAMNARGADEREKELKRIGIERAETKLEYRRLAGAEDRKVLTDELEELERILEKDSIRAPFDGRVENILSLEPGDRLEADEPAFVLADDTRLHIRCEYVSDSVYAQATGGVYALIGDRRYEVERVPMDYKTYLSAVLSGKTVHSVFEFAGSAEGAEEGMYCALVFVNQFHPDELLIPANAVLNDANGKYVYVRGEDGSREKRTVRVSTYSGAVQCIVNEGLEEGETIYVTDK